MSMFRKHIPNLCSLFIKVILIDIQMYLQINFTKNKRIYYILFKPKFDGILLKFDDRGNCLFKNPLSFYVLKTLPKNQGGTLNLIPFLQMMSRQHSTGTQTSKILTIHKALLKGSYLPFIIIFFYLYLQKEVVEEGFLEEVILSPVFPRNRMMIQDVPGKILVSKWGDSAGKYLSVDGKIGEAHKRGLGESD